MNRSALQIAATDEERTRAYSFLHVKSLDAEKRVITGTATTPQTDRTGDIIEPLGVSYKNPLPLLLYHDAKRPVGTVTFAKPTKTGIDFTASIPSFDEPGTIKDRLDEAWHSLKLGLLGGVSIGFRSIEHAFLKESEGIHFLKTEVLELSLVTVPANAGATIHTIKSLDTGLAALGHTPPVVPHLSGVADLAHAPLARRGTTPMTTAEQITASENKRAADVARMNAIQAKASSEDRTKDDAEKEEFDTLSKEIAALDTELVDLKRMEAVNMVVAKPITPVVTQKEASDLRGGTGTGSVSIKSNAEKGSAFVRYAMSVALGKGDYAKTIKAARRWPEMPEVELMVENSELMAKASVYPGTIADATWAGPLAPLQNLTNEFLELLRPATLLGRIPNLRRIPFNASVPIQTAGGTYGWVGEGAPKPVTNLQLGTVTLNIAKVAGIIVLTEELVKLSSPSAEQTVRNDMIAGIAQYLDTQFVDPAVAAVTNVSPASITNGTTPVTSAGTSGANALTDIKALVTAFLAANLSLANAVFLMSEANAFALGTALNALSQPYFPGVTSNGGMLMGRPVITSQALGSNIVLLDAQGILYADDGGVTIDVSREASVEMNTAPTSPVVAGTVLVSLWQQNLVGIRAERFINWKRARLASVKYVVQTYV